MTNRSSKPISTRIIVVMLVLLGVAGGVWMWALTRQGIGIGNDAVVYLAGAKNIFNGSGFTWFSGDGSPRPINHYPPVFSVLLGLSRLFPVSMLTWARFTQVVLFPISIMLFGLLIWRLTRSAYFALVSALIFAASEEMISLHSWAMSDSLFLALVLLFILIAIRHNAEMFSYSMLMLLSLIAGLAALTRYVGVSLIALLVLMVMFEPGRNSGEKVRRVLLGLCLSVLPLAIWLVRNKVLTGSLTNRQPGWFPRSANWWAGVGETILDWLFPGRMLDWLTVRPNLIIYACVILVAILVASAFHHSKRWSSARPKESLNRQSILISAFILIYLGTMFTSAYLSYPDPDINDRTLAPIYISGLILALMQVARFYESRKDIYRASIAIIPLLFLIFKVSSARYIISRLRADGLGYMSTYWQNSETIAALKWMEPEMIYSDNPGAVYFFIGQPAFNIPIAYDPVSKTARADFDESYALMLERLSNENARLVLFNQSARLPEYPNSDALTKDLELVVAHSDGAIYRFIE